MKKIIVFLICMFLVPLALAYNIKNEYKTYIKTDDSLSDFTVTLKPYTFPSWTDTCHVTISDVESGSILNPILSFVGTANLLCFTGKRSCDDEPGYDIMLKSKDNKYNATIRILCASGPHLVIHSCHPEIMHQTDNLKITVPEKIPFNDKKGTYKHEVVIDVEGVKHRK